MIKPHQTDLVNETITAQASAPGRGGIAIVRVSGPNVKHIMTSMLACDLLPRQATYLPFRDTEGGIIDEGIAIYFQSPNSFTGEDVLELHGHGGPFVVDLLIQHIVSLGARLARPGEFSERAFLNGKIDLTQAEAICDLIDASSKQAARLALRSLQGDFSKIIHAITEKIIQVRIYIEAAIDFTDEEIDFLSEDNISVSIQTILNDLISIQSKAKQGSFLREGITVVIAGKPNVGKSSLLNCLSCKEVAIVTDIPGTTRDVLREYILLDDIPIHIIDTAGLRESDDIVEKEGIRRAYQEINKADIIFYLYDASQASEEHRVDTFSACPIVYIRNKIDLIHASPSIHVDKGKTFISLSAKTGSGIDLLKKHIKSLIGFNHHEEGIYLARRRHLDAIKQAHDHVQQSLTQLNSRTLECVAEDLRLAQRALNTITGEFTSDDLLGKIFSNFCIGK